MTWENELIESDLVDKNIDKTPKSDVIFKILFGNPKHPRLLLRMLNAIIENPQPITAVEIKQTELTPEFVGQRGVRLDVLAKTLDGQLINVEIQKNNEHNMVPRSLFHCAKIFSGQAVISEKYEDLKRTVCINIMNFKLFDDSRYWHKNWVTDSETHEKLTDLLELHFLEIPKIKKLQPNSELLFWLEFINDPFSDKIKGMYELEEVYAEAKSAYEKAIADPKVREMLRVREKAEMDYKDAMVRNYDKGEKAGIEKGAHNAKIETARNLLKVGVDINVIATAVGLSIEEIEKICK